MKCFCWSSAALLGAALALCPGRAAPAQEVFAPPGAVMEDRLAHARGEGAIEGRWLGPSTRGPLEEERVGLAEQITAVTRGRVQIEGGYTFIYDRIAGVSVGEHLVPDLLLRIGLTERLELRVGWPGYLARTYDPDLPGASRGETLDPTVGFMLDLMGQDGWIPTTAVTAAVPLALKSDPFAARSFQPLCSLLYRWDLSERLGVGGSTGLAQMRWDGDSFLQLQQTANVDYLLTDRTDVFLEWETLLDHGSVDDGAQHLLSGGLAWLCTDRIEVSWRAGVGLNSRAPDFLTGVRFALRF